MTASSASSEGAACVDRKDCLDDKMAWFSVHLQVVGFLNHDLI